MNFEATGTLYIMRGLPGSGKSTLAKQLGGIIFSTDDFFMIDGQYCFDGSKLGLYHNLNQRRTEDAMRQKQPVIVVDNTNIEAWQMKPYVNLADKYGYKVEIRMPETPWMWDVDKLVQHNTHKVPLEVLQKMKDSFQHNIAVEQIRNFQPHETIRTETA